MKLNPKKRKNTQHSFFCQIIGRNISYETWLDIVRGRWRSVDFTGLCKIWIYQKMEISQKIGCKKIWYLDIKLILYFLRISHTGLWKCKYLWSVYFIKHLRCELSKVMQIKLLIRKLNMYMQTTKKEESNENKQNQNYNNN